MRRGMRGWLGRSIDIMKPGDLVKIDKGTGHQIIAIDTESIYGTFVCIRTLKGDVWIKLSQVIEVLRSTSGGD